MKKFISIVLPYLVVFLATIHRPLDPDLGWHLKYGEYFFKTKEILRDNIFSSEMPDFKWANISWGIDLLYYAFYNLGGFFGLSLASAGIVTLTFLFFSKAYRLDYFEKAIIFSLLLFFLSPINSISFRGQLFSLMIFGLLIWILMSYERGKKKIIFFVPLLMMFWANLHGLFLFGIIIFLFWQVLFVVGRFFENRSVNDVFVLLRVFVPITILSFVATLVHPYGIRIYEDALLHINDPLLKRVTEYGTISHLSEQWYSMIMVGVFAVVGSIFIYVKKNTLVNLPSMGIFYVIYILSMSVRRYSWGMYYVSIPFIKPIASFLKPKKEKIQFKLGSIIFTIILILVLIIKYPYSQFV